MPPGKVLNTSRLEVQAYSFIHFMGRGPLAPSNDLIVGHILTLVARALTIPSSGSRKGAAIDDDVLHFFWSQGCLTRPNLQDLLRDQFREHSPTKQYFKAHKTTQGTLIFVSADRADHQSSHSGAPCKAVESPVGVTISS